MNPEFLRRWALRLCVLSAMVGGGLLSHGAHRASDEVRFARGVVADRVAPHAPTLRAASLGQPTLVGDIFWLRAVLAFADIHDNPDKLSVAWVRAMVSAVNELDPHWRTGFFYGGSFMRVLGDIEGSDEVFAAGHAAMPNDPFFPFSLGMNAYLFRQDIDEARPWISKAASLPDAPAWYRAAVAAFFEEGKSRRAALEYLDRQLKEDQRPQVKEALERKRAMLLHDEYRDQIADHRNKVEQHLGRPIADVAELGKLPSDPYEAGWVLAPDGVVRSTTREALLATRAVKNERAMILLPPSKRWQR